MRYLLLTFLLVGCATPESVKYHPNHFVCKMAVNGITENIRQVAKDELDRRGYTCHDLQPSPTIAFPPAAYAPRMPITCQTIHGITTCY